MGQPALQLFAPQPRRGQPGLTELEISIREYLAAKKQEGLSSASLEKYKEHLRRWGEWLAARGVDNPEQLDKRILREWGATLHDHWQPTTVRLAVATIKGFLRWAANEGECADLAEALKCPKAKSRVQRTLAGDEIDRMMASCDFATPLGLRDAALMSLLTDSGLRASEVCRLTVRDLEFEVQMLPGVTVNRFTVQIKGGGKKPGYLGLATAHLLRRWLAVRQPLARPGIDEIFISLGGTRPYTKLTRFGLRELIADRGQRAGVAGASPHTFRRAFACLLANAGASARSIQELGRWEKLDMVLLYTQAFAAGAHYNQFSPIDYLENNRAK